MHASGTARPPRGPRPRDIIAHTRTLAAQEPMPQQPGCSYASSEQSSTGGATKT